MATDALIPCIAKAYLSLEKEVISLYGEEFKQPAPSPYQEIMKYGNISHVSKNVECIKG